jgi:hypothetical protein
MTGTSILQANPPLAGPDFWLMGLRLLRPHISEEALRDLAGQVVAELAETRSVYLASWDRTGGRASEIWVQPAIQHWHLPEQQEAMLWVAATTYLDRLWHLGWDRKSIGDKRRDFCNRVGCACTDSAVPSVRWASMEQVGTLPNPEFAPWPRRCLVCDKAPLHSDAQNPKCHDSCLHYFQTVVAPSITHEVPSDA